MPIAIGRRNRSASSDASSPAGSSASSRASSPSGSQRGSLSWGAGSSFNERHDAEGFPTGALRQQRSDEGPSSKPSAEGGPQADPGGRSPTDSANRHLDAGERSPTSFRRQRAGEASPSLHVEVRVEFPNAIGPFMLQMTNLAGKFNDYYSKSKIPRPNPESSESAVIGMSLLEMSRDVVLQLSPLRHITLSDEARELTGIPKEASHFAWAYPMVRSASASFGSESTEEGAFLAFGGFVYFDERACVVRAQALAPDRPGSPLALTFGRPQLLPHAVDSELRSQRRFWEVTNAQYARAGATHFAWIRPGEFDMSVACTDGGFAYELAAGSPIYFPVLQKFDAADPGFGPLRDREEFGIFGISESEGSPSVIPANGRAGEKGRWWQCMRPDRAYSQ